MRSTIDEKDTVIYDSNYKNGIREVYDLSSYRLVDIVSRDMLDTIIDSFISKESKEYIEDLYKYYDYYKEDSNKPDRYMKYIIWLDNSEIVAYVILQIYNDGVNFLDLLVITRLYRGHGLAIPIMKYLISKYNVNELSVHRYNKVAIELYKKVEFRFTDKYDSKNSDKDLLFMIR